MVKTIDKKLYQQAYKFYRQWNEAEFVDRIKNAGKLSPAETFQQYVSLVEFCWKLCPQQSESQRKQKLLSIERYYDRIKNFEEWRQLNGKKL